MNTQFNGGRAWRGTNPSRQLDGLSQPLTRQLKDMSQTELAALYDKTSSMLNNPTLKLPDGGAKLKLKLEQIKSLLDASEDNLTNRITDKVSEMSLSEKPNVRKETLLRSNNISDQPSKLLKATTHDGMEQANTRSARMMSLEESMQLQESQQRDIKLANMRKRMESVRGSAGASESLADDLTLTMSNLQLDPETRIPRPDDDGPSDTEGQDKDSDDEDDEDDDSDDMDDDDLYERYDDEGFEEEVDQEFEDGQLHNNNNRRI